MQLPGKRTTSSTSTTLFRLKCVHCPCSWSLSHSLSKWEIKQWKRNPAENLQLSKVCVCVCQTANEWDNGN